MDKTSQVVGQPKNIMRFIVPSAIGVLLFMTPIMYQGEMTIPIAILSKGLGGLLADYLSLLIVSMMAISGSMSVAYKLWKPDFAVENEYVKELFDVSPFWLTCRILGMVFGLLTYGKIGPAFIWASGTGSLLLNDLLTVLFSVFLFAGLCLPLLLNYGLLEFFGALLTRIMKPIFTLPGRASIDCIASWLGDGTIGVLLTSKQYEEGHYSEREAAVIGTTFSAVSVTFSLVVIAQVNLEHLFAPYYLTIILAGVLAAIIMPRIPPLSRKKDRYVAAAVGASRVDEDVDFNKALSLAIKKAESAGSWDTVLKSGLKNVVDMWLGVIPVIMAMGTISLIVAEYTPLFVWLGMPFIPLLELMRVPEAALASQTLVIGFADMFLPAVIGASIESEMTRFVIAGVSVTQLIYMSEVGGLLLGSKIPVSFIELVIIFLQRTLITLPVFVLIGHLIF